MYRILSSIFFILLFCMACSNKYENPNKNIELSDFETLDSSAFTLKAKRIQHFLRQAAFADADSTATDMRVKSYYLNGGTCIWINRQGVNDQADTLLSYLKTVDQLGFSKKKFRVYEIEEGLKRFRTLDFDKQSNSINKVAAQLEYNLTKAYLRYATGQKFGFVNPYRLFNRMDVRDSDSVSVSYATLFDVPMQRVGKDFYRSALDKIEHDSVGIFLHEIQPKSKLYSQLQSLLAITRDKNERRAILCNMDRCRWRYKDTPDLHEKYVLVNIPSFHLRMVNRDDIEEMKIGCGSKDTKTPLLTSRIIRMDVNPQWIVPRSIIKKSIVNHCGDRHYFDSHHFFVRHRKTGKKIPFDQITREMLLSKDYLVIQTGGLGNSLGRIIFRFPNGFSVFLHDTNQQHVFSQTDRDVSHGCVRVERPFDLAVFLLKDKEASIIRKLHYSMTAKIGEEGVNSSEEEHKNMEKTRPDTLKKSLILRSLSIEPQVPIYLTYFTIYPDGKGKLQHFADVYGFDKVIFKSLRNYGAE